MNGLDDFVSGVRFFRARRSALSESRMMSISLISPHERLLFLWLDFRWRRCWFQEGVIGVILFSTKVNPVPLGDFEASVKIFM